MIVAALLAVPASAPATASPDPYRLPPKVPGGFASWGDLAAMQIKLTAAATRFQAAAGRGYAGVIAAPETRRLDLYWKGSVPDDILALIERERSAVPIRVLAAEFS